MLSAAVDRYLAARRAVGFQLRDTEEILVTLLRLPAERRTYTFITGLCWSGFGVETAAR